MSGASSSIHGLRRLHVLLATVLLLWLGGAGAQAVVLWYQHYERGLELAEAQKWREALEELQAAAAVEGRPRAQIRTYGSRFIFDYDPPYHQARCLAELGRLDEAAARLTAAEEAKVTAAADLAALRRRLERLRTARGAASPEAASPQLESSQLGSSQSESPRSADPAPPPARLVVDSTPGRRCGDPGRAGRGPHTPDPGEDGRGYPPAAADLSGLRRLGAGGRGRRRRGAAFGRGAAPSAARCFCHSVSRGPAAAGAHHRAGSGGVCRRARGPATDHRRTAGRGRRPARRGALRRRRAREQGRGGAGGGFAGR